MRRDGLDVTRSSVTMGGSLDILVAVISFRAEGTPRMTLDLCRLWTRWGLRVGILNLQRGPDELSESFEALGVPIWTHPVGRLGYRRYAGLTGALWQIGRRASPRGVLSMPMGLHSFIAAGARLAGVKRIAAHVGNPPLPDPEHPERLRKYRQLVQLGRPFTHRLICCSEYVQAKTIENLGVPTRATEVVYNGVDVEPFRRAGAQGRPRRPEAERPWVIGMVGTLEGHKDQATLIRAASILQSDGAAVHVRLIGDGRRRDELQGLIEATGAPVAMLGSRTDVPEQVADLDVFVFATTDQEGLGIALIEALAAGVPVVASDVPACREVLEEDGARFGALVPPMDPQALARGIAQVLEDRATAIGLAQKAQAMVLGRFSAEAMARRYAAILGVRDAIADAP